MGLIPGLGRSPREGNSYPLQDSFFFFSLQDSCLENSMDRRAWQAHGVAKSRTRLSEHFLFFHSHLEEGRSGVKSLSRVRLFVTP